MTSDRSSRLNEIVGRALELSGDERTRYLQSICRGDAGLLQEAYRLLRGEDTGGPTEILGSMVPGALHGFAVRERFGHFRIIRRIGEGGMGTVFEAEQDNPRRTVALKIIQPGFASPEHLRRFAHEAELLGQLQHPGIAQIYEAGTADVGRGTQPFFAMEIIRGGTMESYAAEKNLDLRARLDFLAKVCDAVHYAHQKGIIHRDLKPGNILVDTFGQPKIVDFGVARMTCSEFQASTMHTQTGQLLGTVHYMSPEQVAGDPNALGIQSDVYSLGVIAYEFISGEQPHDLRHKLLPEAARIIREEDPRPLSTVNRTFRGDVETIISKALEKETSRRYESAAALAADIRRYLGDEPIQARPPSTMYQLRKFARRHRALVGGLVATMLVLAIGAVVSSVEFFRAEKERKAAVAARDEAVQEAAKAQAVTRFLQDMLTSASPYNARGREISVREVLQASSAQVDTAFKDQPLVEAAIRMTIGRTYWQLGDYAESEPQLRKALAIRVRVLGEDHPDVSDSRIALAYMLTSTGQRAEAETLLRAALDVSRRTLGESNNTTVDALHTLGYVLWGEARFDESEKLHRQALEIRKRTAGPENEKTLLEEMHLAMALRDQHRLEEAESLFRDGLEKGRRVLGSDHPLTLHCMNQLGEVLTRENRFPEAEPLLDEALATRTRVYGENHKLVGETLLALSDLRYRQGRLDEAEALARRAVARAERFPDRTTGWARETLLKALLKQNKLDEARPYWLTERENLQKKADAPDASRKAIEDFAWFLLTADPEVWRDPKTALSYAQRAAGSEAVKTPRSEQVLALAYFRNGDSPRAIDSLERALALVSSTDAGARAEIEAQIKEYREGVTRN